MVLLMSRPFKHPKTGIFWLRKRVPKDLVSIVGKAEVSRSLETRDPADRAADEFASMYSGWLRKS